MSIFPIKIPLATLATDGSEQTDLTARTAADLAAKIGSELRVGHVGQVLLRERGYFKINLASISPPR
jgi:nucleotide-binding universal stress UspA family protein